MESSSATHGSSIASVAGKKRPPTKQCALAPVFDRTSATTANAAAPATVLDMEVTPLEWMFRAAGMAGARAYVAVKRRPAARAKRKADGCGGGGAFGPRQRRRSRRAGAAPRRAAPRGAAP